MSNDWQSDAALIKYSYRSQTNPRFLPNGQEVLQSFGSDANGVRIDVLKDSSGNYTVLARGTGVTVTVQSLQKAEVDSRSECATASFAPSL